MGRRIAPVPAARADAMREVQGRLGLLIAEALAAEPAAMIPEHLVAHDAPLKVIGRLSQPALGHCAAILRPQRFGNAFAGHSV